MVESVWLVVVLTMRRDTIFIQAYRQLSPGSDLPSCVADRGMQVVVVDVVHGICSTDRSSHQTNNDD